MDTGAFTRHIGLRPLDKAGQLLTHSFVQSSWYLEQREHCLGGTGSHDFLIKDVRVVMVFLFHLEDFLYVAEHEDHEQVLVLLWQSFAADDGSGERPLHC